MPLNLRSLHGPLEQILGSAAPAPSPAQVFAKQVRFSFPATGHQDPGTDFKTPGSLTYHRCRHLLERVFEGFLKAF